MRGTAAGIVAALLAAIVDLLLNLPDRGLPSFVVGLGILLPFGAAAGFLPATIHKYLFHSIKDTPTAGLWRETGATGRSVRILVYGLTFIAGAKICYTAIHFFAVGFHHQGLAALALLLFLGVAALLGGLFLPFVSRSLEKAARRLPAIDKLLGRPIAPICFLAGAALGILLPPLHIGPSAGGPFGFIGQLGLDRAATILLLLLPFVSLALTAWSRPISLRRLLPILAATVVLAGAAPFAARTTIQRSPNIRASIETGIGPVAAFLRFTGRGMKK